jgi:TPR repeat protein
MFLCPAFHRAGSFARWLRVLVFLGLGLVSGPALSDTKEATTAFSSGQHDAALAEFRRMAERGDSEAEFMLGVMYYQGHGVEQNRPIAAVWFHKSALKGHKGAQLAFGSIHIRGVGVYQNLGQAWKWLALAAKSPSTAIRNEADSLLKDAKRLMTAREVMEADEEALNFKAAPTGLVSQ